MNKVWIIFFILLSLGSSQLALAENGCRLVTLPPKKYSLGDAKCPYGRNPYGECLSYFIFTPNESLNRVVLVKDGQVLGSFENFDEGLRKFRQDFQEQCPMGQQQTCTIHKVTRMVNYIQAGQCPFGRSPYGRCLDRPMFKMKVAAYQVRQSDKNIILYRTQSRAQRGLEQLVEAGYCRLALDELESLNDDPTVRCAQ